jgi:hypothetical protein
MPVRHDFIFTNIGRAKLEISGVHPSCGCTTVGAWSREVEPGKTGMVSLEFNTAHIAGNVAKSATVCTSDKSQPAVLLRLLGTITSPVENNPAAAVVKAASSSTSNTPAMITVPDATPNFPATPLTPTSNQTKK